MTITFNAVHYDFLEAHADMNYCVLVLEYMPYGDLKKVIGSGDGRGQLVLCLC